MVFKLGWWPFFPFPMLLLILASFFSLLSKILGRDGYLEVDIPLTLSVFTILLAGIIFVIQYYQAKNLSSLSTQITAYHIDEKIAVMFGYAHEAPNWQDTKDIQFLKEKIITDITALGRLRPSISPDQIGKLARGVNGLINRMSQFGHPDEAREIDLVFKLLFQ